MNDLDQSQKPKRRRSPAYPGINLEVALDLAQKLKEHQGEHPTHPHVVFEVWGYKGHTGPAAVALAALSYFGLVDDAGTGEDRRVKISQLALGILWDKREESSERDQAVKRAALSPKIHRKVWDHFQGHLPPTDAGLRWYLLNDEKFSEAGADEFIRQFRHTIAFAKLESSDSIPGQEKDKKIPQRGVPTTPAPTKVMAESQSGAYIPKSEPCDSRTDTGTITFPLSPRRWVKIELPYQLSEEEWKRIKDTLDVFKPGFMKEIPQFNEED